MQRTAQGKDFELILTVKMETRHSVQGPFGVNFLTSVIIAELWWPEFARSGNFADNFCVFWKKRPLMVKVSKLCFESLHGDTD